MADFQQYSVVQGANTRVTVPTYTISGQITDSSTGAVLANFTGASAVQFPAVLASLTAAQQTAIVQSIAQTILLMLAGLWTG